MALLAFFAFVSGLATIASPCVLPLLPVALAGGVDGGPRRPLGIAAGFAASFAFFALALSAIVAATGLSADALRFAAAALVAAFGLVMLVPRLGNWFEASTVRISSFAANRVSSLSAGQAAGKGRSGFAGGFALGSGLALVWTPCVGPIMASVLSLAVAQKVDGGAVLIASAYALGAAIPMLAIMTAGKRISARLSGALRNSRAIKKGAGILMLATALAVATGADRAFQNFLISAFPAYGAGLTRLENSSAVRRALNERRGGLEAASGKEGASDAPADFVAVATAMRGYAEAGTAFAGASEPSSGGLLRDYGYAPPLVAAGPWLGGGAVTMAELRGKVLLIDFWTYSCVNCVRTIPALRAWHRAYAKEGLAIVGVHSPEFEFETSTANVAAAMKSLGVEWRVVQDNDFAQWNAYSNQYWPAHYLVDARGRVRYVHFGEGGFVDTERAIQALLAEAEAEAGTSAPGTAGPSAAGAVAQSRFVSPREPDLQDGTPELYLGYARGRGFVSAVAPAADEAVDYAPEREPGNAEWNLEGRWTISSEYSAPEVEGVLNLGFQARDLYLVLVPGGRGSSVRVLVDGSPPPDAGDVKGGRVRLSGARMYHLASFPSAAFRRLRLEVRGGTKLYAFTFG